MASDNPVRGVDGHDLMAACRLWMEKATTPEQQRELAPLIDRYEQLLNEGTALSARVDQLGPVRTPADADRARPLAAEMEHTLAVMERQRMAIHDWMAAHRAARAKNE